MKFKKIVGLLIAMMTFWSASTMTKAEDITDEASLTQLLTTSGGDGTVLNSFSTANAINATLDVVLHSSDTNKFSLSGEAISFAAGKSLTLYDIGITNALSFTNAGTTYSTLTLGDKTYEKQGITLGAVSGTANIIINSGMPVNFSQNISANTLSISPNATSHINLQGNVDLVSEYSQSGGTTVLSTGNSILAKNVLLSGGELQLNANSTIKATDTTLGTISVTGGKVNSSTLNKNGIISATKGYSQTGDGSAVYAQTLTVGGGDVTLGGGVLTVENLGNNDNKVTGNYTQTGGTLNADNAYITGNTTITSGTATVNKNATVNGYILVNGGNFTVKDGVSSTDKGYVHTDSTFTASSGSVNLGNYSVLDAAGNIQIQANTTLGSNASINSSGGSVTVENATVSNPSKSSIISANKEYVQKGATSNVTVAEIVANSVDVQGGTLVATTIGKNGSPIPTTYSQSNAGSNVTVDNLYTTGNIGLTAGQLTVNSQANSAADINIAGTLNANGSVHAGGKYTQTNGAVTLATGKTIEGASVQVSSGNVILGSGSTLQSTTGDVEISGTTTSVTNENRTGSIVSAQDYIQKGTSQVEVDNLSSARDVNLSGGTLTVKTSTNSGRNLIVSGGTYNAQGNTNVVGSISQSGGSVNATTNNIIAGTGVNLTGGELALGNAANSSVILRSTAGNISVENANINKTAATKTGIIEAKAGTYSQSGTSNVSVNEIYAKDVDVQGGSLKVNKLGSNASDSTMLSTYSQSGVDTQVNAGALYTTGNINIDGGSFVSTGDMISKNGLYSQTAGSVTVGDAKNLSANSISVTGGTVALGDGSTIKSTTTGITVTDSTITDVNKTGTINSAGSYIQTGATSDVTAKNLFATGSVSVADGKLTTTYLGSDVSRIGSYSQTGTANVVTDYIYTKDDATGTISISGGSFTINLGAEVGGDFTVSGATTKFINNCSDGKFNVKGKFTQETGTTIVVGNNKTLNAIDYVVAEGSTLELLQNSKVNTSNSFKVNGGTISDQIDGGDGTGVINAGKSYLQTGDTSNVTVSSILANSINGSVKVDAGTLNVGNIGSAATNVNTFTQTGGTVNVTDGLYTSGDTIINGGSFTSKKIASGGALTVNGATTTVNSTDIGVANSLNVQAGSLTATNIGRSDSKIGSYYQTGGTTKTKYLYSTGAVEFKDGSTFTAESGGSVSTEGLMSIAGTNSHITFNGNVNVGQSYNQQQTTVNTANGITIEVGTSGIQLDNNAILNLGEGATLKTTGGDSPIYVLGGSQIAGGNGIVQSSNDYKQTGGTTSVNVRSLNATRNIEIGSVDYSGGTLIAQTIGSAVSAPIKYTQYGSNVTVNDLYAGASGVALTSSPAVTGGMLTVNNLLSSSGNIIVDDGVLNLNGMVNSDSQFVQNAGETKLAANKTLSATSLIDIKGGKVALGSGSSLKTTSTTANVNVSGNATINADAADKIGIINSGSNYMQSTSGIVRVNQIFAGVGQSATNVGVNVSGTGTLDVNDIGTTQIQVGGYIQGTTGTPTVSASQIQSDGNVVVSGGTLTVSDKIGSNEDGRRVKSYTQNKNVETVSVGSGGLNSASDVVVAAGTLTANGNVVSSEGKFTQTGTSIVNLAGSKSITANNAVKIADTAKLNLGAGSTVNAGAGMTVSNSAVISDADNTGTINVTGNYLQDGAATNVATKYLYSTGNVNIEAGTLNASNIGGPTTAKRIFDYAQGSDASTPTVTVDNIYASNSVNLINGTLTVNGDLNSSKGIVVSDGTLNVNDKVTAGTSYTQSGGTVNVAAGKTITAKGAIEVNGGEMVLGEGSVVSATEGTADITVKNNGKINSTTHTNVGTLSANNSYKQDSSTSTVYVDQIEAKQNVEISGGALNANNIGTSMQKIGGSYIQKSTSTTNVASKNIYANAVDIQGGTLTLGDAVNNSVLSSTNNISISGGTLNLYNTTFKASTIAPTTGSSVNIDGGTVNFYGNSNLGLFDTNNYINSITIGGNLLTTLNVGDGIGTNDTLNFVSGAGNIAFGPKTQLNILADGITNLTAQNGDIVFDANSTTVNRGILNILTGNAKKAVTLGNINDDANMTGEINNNGNTVISGNVYTDLYNQTTGSTKINAGSSLNAGNAGNAIDIQGGSFSFNGESGSVVAENGTFNMDNGTSLLVESGKNSSLSANTISLDGTTFTMAKDTGLTIKPGAGNATFNNVATTINQSAELTLDTANGNVNFTNSTINADQSAKVNVNGNSSFVSTNTTIGTDAALNLDTTKGSINYDANSKITNNSGKITITGDANEVTLAGGVNSATNKKGDIEKTGANTLNVNGAVYGSKLTLSNGTTNVNADMAFSGDVKIEGSVADNKIVTVNIDAGKSLSTTGDISVGSITNYDATKLNLKENSILSGKNVNLNAVVNVVKAIISADKDNGGNVTIGEKTNLTVEHYDPDGANLTITTIRGNEIKISGGSLINILEGAQLVYDGKVISTDAHYDVAKGAQWVATGGDYTNAEYQGTPGGAVLTNLGDVTLNNDVTFKDSNALHEGGAIYNTGSLKAYYNADRGEYAVNTKFIGNKAGYNKDGNPSVYPDQNGGAIYNGVAADGTNGVVILGKQATFEKNVATGNGGAIYNVSAGNLTENAVKLGDEATFTNNNAFGQGGAIYAGGTGTVVVGSNAKFEGNKAGYDALDRPQKNSDGGAIYVIDGATVSLGSNATFTSNVATKNGGAIANSGTITFDGSSTKTGNYSAVFTKNNTTDGNGGAIYNTGEIITKTPENTNINGFINAVFGTDVDGSGNSAANGGAIYSAIADDKVFILRDTIFRGNKASKDGGAIYNASGTLDIQSGTNFVKNEAEENGGAIYNANGATVQLFEGAVLGGDEPLGNIANRGAAIYNDGKLIANGTEDNKVWFIGNKAKTQGGALYNNGTINDPANSTLNYVNFSNNIAGDETNKISGQGGAIYQANGDMTLNNSTLSGNKTIYTSSQGGAIYNAVGNLTIGEKTIITGNQALGSDVEGKVYAQGGAIYNASTLTVKSGAALQLNKTDGQGGAIYNANGATTVLESGAVIGGLLDEYYSEATPTAGNEALQGGGIYNSGTLSFPNNSVYFVGNKATQAGGALYNDSQIALDTSANHLIFYGNSVVTGSDTVKGLGGAIYNAENSANVTIDKVYFETNSADIGSAIYNAGNMMITNGNDFEGNTKGSAIGNEGVLTLAKGYSFGYDKKNAGALWNQGDGVINLTVSSSLDSPYSLYIQGTGYLENEKGVVNGAGLHLTDESTINTTTTTGTVLNNTLSTAIFSENLGYLGGALYKDSSVNLTISNSKFEFNSALSNDETAAGGAIYNIGNGGKESIISIDNSTVFDSNTTSGKGGAIYNGAYGTIKFGAGYVMGSDTQGHSNVAAGGGGAIANEGDMYFTVDSNSNRSIYFKYQGGATKDIFNGKGGALYVGEKGLISTYASDGTLMVNELANAVFTNNESKQGGAIYKDNGLYKLIISGTQFSGNRGYLEGGAIYNNIGEIALTLSNENSNIMVGNQAGNDMSSIAASGKGGAIYNAGVMSINNASDKPTQLFISNTATGKDGSGGAIYNTSDLTVNGNVEFYKNAATATGGAITSSGSLVLNLTNGDIVFSQNTAEKGSAIYLTNGSLTIQDSNKKEEYNTLTFVDADAATGTIAQTLASEGSNALAIRGGKVNFFSDASGYGGTYYQTGGIVTVKNKFLNISDGPIRTVTGGELILDQGAELSSDYLLVSNVETDSDNSAKIIFNDNTKASLTDLSALYDNTASNNYFLYGNEENGTHKVALRAADVEINDAATIAKDSTIGNMKNTYAVRNLKLSNGATLGAGIKVYGASNASEVGATLTMAEGSLGSDKATVALKGYNSKLELSNTATTIEIGGGISNDGPTYKSEIEKTGKGTVILKGDNSNYNGVYSQTEGTVEFADGSKYFGANTTNAITGGTLKIDEGVTFQDGTVIDIDGVSTFSTAKKSDVDLTGTSGAILNMSDPTVVVNLGQNTTLEVTNNANVNATQDEIKIGNDNLQVNSVILGGASQNGGAVNVTVNPNTKFILQNDEGTPGKGGVLGFGENVVFKDTAGTTVTPTVQLKDNTQLKFTNQNDSTIALTVQSIDATGNINPTWADTNGDIVKENKGTATVTGNLADFHGSLIVKDGEFATSGTKFNADVMHDLSLINDGANARVKNVTANNDVVIVGDVASNASTAKYNLTVENDRGNIVLNDVVNGDYSDVYVKNGSTATFKTPGTTYIGDLVIDKSTVNMAQGNMIVAGNMTMGSTFNMANGSINTQNIAGNLTLTGNSDYQIDINPMLNQYDKVVIGGNLASNVAGQTRAMDVSEWTLLSDPIADAAIYKIFDVKGTISDVVFTSSNQYKSTPIANYMFSSMGNGSYMLTRSGYSSSAMAVPVALQAGGYLNQLATYDMAFGNLDTVMTLPVVGYNGNKYADANPDDTIVYSPLFIPELEKGIWFRPYGNFESIDLNNGPSVTNQSYGAFVGGDTPLTEIGHGFQGTLSGYVGYTGSHQSFGDASNYQNGGTVGVTGAVYKGGFFSGLTVNVNATNNNSSTLYGKNDFFMLGAGIASKTGYNWELARGRFIIQPSWLMSYSFINAFDPGNLSVYKVDAQALHGVQLAPQLKVIANLPHGWQPYLLCNLRWNIADDTNVKIGSIDLPNTSVKPYVEYGFGMQKRWGERFTGFGQFIGRGGGRNGVGLNFGLRWSIGSGR